jgi:hypothetical protein
VGPKQGVFLDKKEREARNDSGSSFMTIQLVQSR